MSSPEPRDHGRRGRRTRVLLAGGLLTLPLVGGTSAAWVDTVEVGGTTVTGGTIDLRLDGTNAVTAASLSMPAMVPGSRSAQVLAVGNAGTAPLRWSATGALGGADAATYAASGALRVTLVRGGTRTVGATGATCTGGTRPDGTVALAAPTTQVGALRGVVRPGEGESVCVELSLADDAPSSLQGRSTTVTLVATGTSDVGS